MNEQTASSFENIHFILIYKSEKWFTNHWQDNFEWVFDLSVLRSIAIINLWYDSYCMRIFYKLETQPERCEWSNFSILTRQMSAIPSTKVANRLSFFRCFLWSRCFISSARNPSVSRRINVSRLSFDFKILMLTPLVVLAAVTAKSRLYMLFSNDDLPVDSVPKIETICTFWYSSLLLKILNKLFQLSFLYCNLRWFQKLE